MSLKSKKVAVLMGGWSAEDQVSMVSGRACAQALSNAGYDVKEVIVGRDLSKLVSDLGTLPDVVFNALHGQGGEDGCIQAFLDMLGVKYTHSGCKSSMQAMNKDLSKNILAQNGMPVASSVLLKGRKICPENIPFDPPYVVKPNNEGSSVGIFIIHKITDLPDFSATEWAECDMMVEKYIAGRELTVTVMEPLDAEPYALTVTEIQSPDADFYDYNAKYSDGGSSHIIPAKINQNVFDEIMRLSVLAHKNLNCSEISRSDFRYDDSLEGVSGLCYLETNTQPGMTFTSLVPEQADFKGMDFEFLVSWLVENASCHG